MALRNIVKVGDGILRERSREVTEFNDRLGKLIDDMIETMIGSDGAGLAAPQVGILKRVCVVSVDGGETVYELVNPVIKKASGKQCGPEGCLSIPNVHGDVVRPRRLTVEAYDRYGNLKTHKVSDYAAVAFSHEIDHLDGVLFTDKMLPAKDKK